LNFRKIKEPQLVLLIEELIVRIVEKREKVKNQQPKKAGIL